jgi:putative transposase
MKKHDLALADTGQRRGQWRYCRMFVLVRQRRETSVGVSRRLHRWAPIIVGLGRRLLLDFVATGRRFRILNIVDAVTRECLAAITTPQSRASGWPN